MGLKYFHFVFIALASLCLLGFGLWALVTPDEVVDRWGRAGGALSTLLGFSLVAYGIWFLRKSRSFIT